MLSNKMVYANKALSEGTYKIIEQRHIQVPQSVNMTKLPKYLTVGHYIRTSKIFPMISIGRFLNSSKTLLVDRHESVAETILKSRDKYIQVGA